MNDWWLLSILLVLTLLASLLLIYPLRRSLRLSGFFVPVIFLMAGTGYYFWGSFSQWQQFLHQSESRALAQQMLKSVKSPQELIDKLKAKLDDTPKSAKGWYLLGRLYTSQNDPKNAASAFAKAYQFNPDDEQYAVNYAHSLWLVNGQQFNPEILALFHSLLQKNPEQPDALAMLAMDAFLSHSYNDAIDYWQRLLKLAPEQSEEAVSLRKAIAKAQERINLGSEHDDR